MDPVKWNTALRERPKPVKYYPILKATETVSQQVGEIAAAIQQMSTSSSELVGTMQTVSTIVEGNTLATEQMAGSSSELTQAVESIASVSEENSAAVEQVSASTEEVLAQVEQVASSAGSLMEMAKSLQRVVSQFSLDQSQSAVD